MDADRADDTLMRSRVAALVLAVAALFAGGCGAAVKPGVALQYVGIPYPEQGYQGPVGGSPLWFGLFSVDNASPGPVIFEGVEAVRIDAGVQVLGIELYLPDERTPAGLIDGDCGTPDPKLKTYQVAGHRLAAGRTAGLIVRLVAPPIAGERGIRDLRIRYRTAPGGQIFQQTFAYRATGDHLPTGPPCGRGTSSAQPSTAPV